jgi:hypothetical protein
MMKKLYLPFTRMNLVVSLDDGLLAPPSYLNDRKYHEDFTHGFPNNILAFEFPSCPVLPEKWTDEESREDATRIREIDESLLDDKVTESRKNKLNDEKRIITDKSLHFPVIVEVEIDEDLLNSSRFQILSDSTNEPITDEQKPNVSEVYLLTKALPVDSILRILTPGPQTAVKLSDDPFLKLFDWSFKISGIEKPPNFCELPNGEVENLNDHQRIGCDQLNFNNGFCGVAALLAASTKTQNWFEGECHTTVASFCLSLFFGKFGLNPSKKSDLLDFTKHDYFQKSDQSNLDKIKNLADIFNEIVTRDNDETEEGLQDTNQSDEIEFIDNKVFLELSISCLKGNPESTSPVEILKQVIESCFEGSTFDDVNSEIVSKYKKILLYAEKVHKGNGELGQLFSEKTTQFHAAKSAMLFLLNPSPEGILNWSVENKPEGVVISEYFKAVTLVALFHGFSGISPKWKKDWRKAFSFSLSSEEFQLEREISIWELKEGRIKGDLTASISNSNRSGDESFTLSFGLNEDISPLISSFRDLVIKAVEESKIDNPLIELVEILAKFNNLGDEFQNDVYDVSQIKDIKELVREGLLIISKSLFTGGKSISWNHEKILKEFKDSSEIRLNKESIVRICELCQLNIPEIRN